MSFSMLLDQSMINTNELYHKKIHKNKNFLINLQILNFFIIDHPETGF